jgi:deazaflavin-dependent oxidoreductase (nitroreductase family)
MTPEREDTKTVMECGCVFTATQEGQNIFGNYVLVCDSHKDYPDYARFRQALHAEHTPQSQEIIRKFNERLTAEARAGYRSSGNRIPECGTLLLTTTGAKSRLQRTVPLAYQRDGDSFVVQGSAGGRTRNPDWLYNVLREPRVEIEVANRRLPAAARVTQGAERERLIAASRSLRPGTHERFWTETVATIDREVPIVVITPTATPGPSARSGTPEVTSEATVRSE